MSYTLEIRHADGRVETREFEQAFVQIGRDDVDLRLDDPRLSGRHAELHYDGRELYVRDLSSTNGSFDHAGQRLREPLRMQLEQAVRVGDTYLTLRSLTAAAVPHARASQPRLTLHLRELRCIAQQELDGDEPYLFVRKNKVWSCQRMRSGVTVLLGSVPPTNFTEDIDVALMEKDVFADDRLGSGTATIDDLGRGLLNFDWTEAGCHYQLLYEVTLAQPDR